MAKFLRMKVRENNDSIRSSYSAMAEQSSAWMIEAHRDHIRHVQNELHWLIHHPEPEAAPLPRRRAPRALRRPVLGLFLLFELFFH